MPDRRDELARELLVVGIVRRDQRRQQRHQHDRQQDRAADQQSPVAEDAPAQQGARRRRENLGSGRYGGTGKDRLRHLTPP